MMIPGLSEDEKEIIRNVDRSAFGYGHVLESTARWTLVSGMSCKGAL